MRLKDPPLVGDGDREETTRLQAASHSSGKAHVVGDVFKDLKRDQPVDTLRLSKLLFNVGDFRSTVVEGEALEALLQLLEAGRGEVNPVTSLKASGEQQEACAVSTADVEQGSALAQESWLTLKEPHPALVDEVGVVRRCPRKKTGSGCFAHGGVSLFSKRRRSHNRNCSSNFALLSEE